MPEQFLYESLNAVSNMGFLKKEIPDSVKLNLNPNPDKPEIPMTKSQFPNNNQIPIAKLYERFVNNRGKYFSFSV